MEGDVDVVVLGTGLTESITAAALSKAGYRIAHIDVNPYYGADEASLSLEELVQWAKDRSSSDSEQADTYWGIQRAKFTSISQSASTFPQSRQYALSLAPSLIPSVGPMITSLVSSGVARYGGYRLIERVGAYDSSGVVKTVPGSKEDVFKNKDISLVDKRRLMRFLMFAAANFEDKKELEGKADTPFLDFLKTVFSLNEEIAGVITYSLAYCASASDPTLPALLRIRSYLRSGGRYGSSPFIVGHYGGSGEIAQGFCRAAAVAGGIYILGRRISAITSSTLPHTVSSDGDTNSFPSRYTVELEGVSEKIACPLIISSLDHIPAHLLPTARHIPQGAAGSEVHSSVARCIAIIDRPISFSTSSSIPGPPISDAKSADDPTSPPEDSMRKDIDTAVLIFPPSSLSAGSATTAVHVMITGEGSMSTPKGKWIVYLSMPLLEPTSSSPELILKPYLDATLSLTTAPLLEPPTEPLFTTYYIQHPSRFPVVPSPISNNSTPTVLVTPSPATLLTESSNSAATNAEAVFWEAVHTLKALGIQPRGDDADPDQGDVEGFWPLIEGDPDEEGEAEW